MTPTSLLRDPSISSHAVRLWSVLAYYTYGDQATDRPSRSQLASDVGWKPSARSTPTSPNCNAPGTSQSSTSGAPIGDRHAASTSWNENRETRHHPPRRAQTGPFPQVTPTRRSTHDSGRGHVVEIPLQRPTRHHQQAHLLHPARCSARCRISSGTRNDTRGQWSPQRRPAARAAVNAWMSACDPPAVQSEHHLGVHIDITTVDSLGGDPVVLGIDHPFLLLLRMVGASQAAFLGMISAWSVLVLSMVDTDNYHLSRVLAESVQHSVGTAAGRPDASEVTPQRFADTSWFCHQRGGEEVDHCSSDRFGQSVGQCAPSGRGKDELVGFRLGQRARRRTASMPRTTSPRA